MDMGRLMIFMGVKLADYTFLGLYTLEDWGVTSICEALDFIPSTPPQKPTIQMYLVTLVTKYPSVVGISVHLAPKSFVIP